jgi:hypothetical protein
VLPQVSVPSACRSWAPTTPERRPARRRCQASSPSHPLRLRARLPLLRTVSNNPPLKFSSSCALWCAHKLAGAAAPPSSGAGRRRAMIDPLDPLSRARVFLLYNAAARGRIGGREHCPVSTPASRHRAPPRGLPPRRVRRRACVHRIWTVGSRVDGQDRIPLRVMWPVHCEPVSRAHGAAHRACTHPQLLGLRSMARLRRFL